MGRLQFLEFPEFWELKIPPSSSKQGWETPSLDGGFSYRSTGLLKIAGLGVKATYVALFLQIF